MSQLLFGHVEALDAAGATISEKVGQNVSMEVPKSAPKWVNSGGGGVKVPSGGFDKCSSHVPPHFLLPPLPLPPKRNPIIPHYILT